ncbi:MAG: ATP-binding cassette domain-containing protein [Desulfovibrio sp.]|jgi:molybdate transport system ATP-binding protein|nr:ATP-binding cassette domain-containing protein [Desulfovibrio sp.]
MLRDSPLVTVTGLSLFLPGDSSRKMVLRDIDFSLREGGHCVFVGPNGAGKSTLLRLLHGELWPARGSILWHAAEGAEASPLAGRAMSALVSQALQENYQHRAREMTGRELLSAALAGASLPYAGTKEVRRAEADEMIARLSAGVLLDRKVAALSQGQLRLLLLARALLRSPRLLLLDECANGLDAPSRKRFFDLLAEYAGRCTVVMTAHRSALIPAWCAERRYIKDGRLTAAEAARFPASRRHSGRCPGGKDRRAAGQRAKPRFRTPQLPSEGAAGAGGLLFSLKNVSVFIDRHKVLRNITWTMREGERWQVLGANGSGKSTLLRLLAGDEFAAAGGEVLRHLPRRGGPVRTLEQLRKGVRLVGDLSQALYAYDLSGLELVCSGFDNTIGIYRDFTGHERQNARMAMAALRVSHLAGASIRRLSSGQLRCLFLARALVGEPEILLLDEPCNGLDAENRLRYLDILDSLVERGMHFVFVSHYAQDAPLCVNRRARMENGRLVQS